MGVKLSRITLAIQYILPQHTLTALANRLARVRVAWFKNNFITLVMRWFRIDLSDAIKETATDYEHFNAFFTRALIPESRPIAQAPLIASPVDGTVSAIGKIDETQVFQAKDKFYSLYSLLAGHAELTRVFSNGIFATLYLAPHNYHRIHLPLPGQLEQMHCVPGKLFSVNETSVNGIDNLFARNERVISIFSTSASKLAIIKVGALNVGSIETVWQGVVTPNNKIRRQYYEQGPEFEQGQEIARFNFGSTVILLLPEGNARWEQSLKTGDRVKMGQAIGRCLN